MPYREWSLKWYFSSVLLIDFGLKFRTDKVIVSVVVNQRGKRDSSVVGRFNGEHTEYSHYYRNEYGRHDLIDKFMVP